MASRTAAINSRAARPALTHGRTVHLYVSRHNAGAEALTAEQRQLTARAQELAGEAFSLSSPDQVQRSFFQREFIRVFSNVLFIGFKM